MTRPAAASASALAALQAFDGDVKTARTAAELGVSASTLRALAAKKYLTIGTRNSSLRGGERSTYKMTYLGRLMVRQAAADASTAPDLPSPSST